MTVMTASIVRNGEGYLNRYFLQLADLRMELQSEGHLLKTALLYGDCTDATASMVTNQGFDVLIQHDHGGPAFGSVNNATRWANIAKCWNHLFDRLKAEQFDALIYVEADLIWAPVTMVQLLNHLEQVPAVAPLSMKGPIFYDSWGYRAYGQNFGHNPPYHPRLAGHIGLFKLDSAGSCKVLRAEVVRKCRFSEVDAMLGHSIYEHGFSLWLDPTCKVEHP